MEEISNGEVTRNGVPPEERNMDEVQWIMGRCVTESFQKQYTNDFIIIHDMDFWQGWTTEDKVTGSMDGGKVGSCSS